MKISILMTTYNSSSFILDAVSSILNQTFGDFEFIIIDDGSEDETCSIVKNIQDNRISYEHINHSGRVAALNYGLNKCSSEWVALMDSDDLSLPDRLQKQISYNNKINADVISSWYGIFSKNNLKYIIKTPENNLDIKKSLPLHSVISNPGVMFRKSVILDSGGYDDPETNFEDYLLWLKIKNKATFYNIPEVLILQRYRPDSISRKNLQEKHKEIYDIQATLYNYSIISSSNDTEKLMQAGWREYFYGNPVKGRKIWFCVRWKLFTQLNILPAILISYFPIEMIIRINELRMKFRIYYISNYFSSKNRYLRKFLNFHNQNMIR
jgi:glycosyltransferase involved in cell wall biosynthesis